VSKRKANKPIQTDREPHDSPQPNDTNDTKSEEILSKPAHKTTAARMRAFLNAYARTGRVHQSCEIAHITHKTHYRKLESDPAYRQAFERAEQQVGQMLEDTAVERALDGDNHLLLALLKRFRPEAYRERVSAEVSGTINLVDRMNAAVERVRLMRRNDSTTERAG
jgi:hypothetical protein